MPKDTTNGKCTCKPWEKPKPYDCQPKEAPKKDVPKTLGKVIKPDQRENLTLADWLTVLEFWDKHKCAMSQKAVFTHFKGKKDGSLTFTQGALSRAIAQCAELEAHKDVNPTALSSKQAHVVMCPDVAFTGNEQFTLSYIEAVDIETSILVSEHVGPTIEVELQVTPLGESHSGHKIVTNVRANISHNALARGRLRPHAL